MSTRYDNLDYGRRDRDDERYGRRSESVEGPRRGYGGYGGGRMVDYEGSGREGAYGEYDRSYGSSAGNYDRRDYRAGRGYEDYGYGRDSNYGIRGYGREGYQGGEYDRGYGGESSYGIDPYEGRYGRGDYERNRYGYSGPYDRYSERYNYPSGYRSGETYGRRYGRDYEREGYGGRGEERGWWERASDEVSSWFGDEEAKRRRRVDEQSAQHRGRGPKGYRRSDERIKEDISDRLSDDPYLDASDVEVSMDNGEVTLTGTVEGRTAKRRTEEIAESVSGVTNVENRLRVRQGVRTGVMAGTGPADTATGPTGTAGITGAAAAGAGTTATGGARAKTT